ncbi:hypothetical protein IKS86_04555 [bacterium]|nr:hypothetical protein [bacterium]
MLTFILKKECFEKIDRGEKRVEYREVKPYWTQRLFNAGWALYECRCGERMLNIFQPRICVFRLGYTDTRTDAYIDRIDIVDGKESDLHIDKPVYAIHFRLKGDKDGTL